MPHGVTSAGPRRRTSRYGPAAGVALAAVIAALGFWFAYRPWASERRAGRGLKADSPMAVAAATAGTLTTVPDSVSRAALDSARRDSAARAAGIAMSPDSFPVLAAANASDSAVAAGFAVLLETTLTKSGAILNLAGKYKSVPAGTFSIEPQTRRFRVLAGAYATKAGGDSLLGGLPGRGIAAPNARVVQVPYAFLLKSDVPADEVPGRLKPRVANGQPVYALRQPNGTAHLYFGAYESPQQAALAVPSVREAGLTPTLVYRIGRVF
jgi:hypothetical protein